MGSNSALASECLLNVGWVLSLESNRSGIEEDVVNLRESVLSAVLIYGLIYG